MTPAAVDKCEMTSFWGDPSLKIYLSHFLSSWGDRMAQFTVGYYLVSLYDDILLPTAIYGFASAISVIFTGAFIGRWIDKTERNHVAVISLLVQNITVLLSSVVLVVFIKFRKEIGESYLFGGYLAEVLLCLIIIIAVIAGLATVANKISLEKDWIVVLSQGDEIKLSKMNTFMRTLNMGTYILAPILVGQLITYWSDIASLSFVAGWNVCSGICEIQLLSMVFKNHPHLRDKLKPQNLENGQQNTQNKLVVEEGNPFLQSFKGWKDYNNHRVRNAGLALASLYMTVLGLDNITTGYLLAFGLSASLISTITATSAIFGICGAISFPLLRKLIGKLKTGVFGFGIFGIGILPCVISIFIKGSPFEPSAILHSKAWFGSGYFSSKNHHFHQEKSNNYTTDTTTTVPFDFGYHQKIIEFGSISILFNGEYNSEVIFIIGLLLSIYGFWLSDLSVTQTLQEEIPEDKRGIINGVQYSLNQIMNTLKFLMVIFLPQKETFGYLIILSWIFIFFGFTLFTSYAIAASKRNQKEFEQLISDSGETDPSQSESTSVFENNDNLSA